MGVSIGRGVRMWKEGVGVARLGALSAREDREKKRR
jgi:hypothetical protein